jgi:hypothetical protein
MHGEVVNVNVMGPELDHVLTVDQSFVLRRRREEEESSDEDALGAHGGYVHNSHIFLFSFARFLRCRKADHVSLS